MEIGREGGLDSRADGPRERTYREASGRVSERGILKFNSSKSDLSRGRREGGVSSERAVS